MAGYDPDGFWCLTPVELYRRLTAATRRFERQRQQAMSVAWHTAALQRAKTMPRLNSFLKGAPEHKPPRRQSWQEQLAILNSLG